MTAPRLKGLHHIKLPVTDLDTSLSWYQRVFDAEHLSQFDHYDGAGARYAVIPQLPGVDILIELRWAPDAATATAGYDPVSLVAGGADDLQAWIDHLDALRREDQLRYEPGAGCVLVTDEGGTATRVSLIRPRPAGSSGTFSNTICSSAGTATCCSEGIT
jgi:catechol 2,3-dioxygenase-like lactoylglutathione lyase family enzyme